MQSIYQTQPWLVTEVQAGEPVEVGSVRLIPMGKSTRLRLPGAAAGAVWNRPASVVVEAPGGEIAVLPIRDYTRIVQLALLGTAVAASAALWLFSTALKKR